MFPALSVLTAAAMLSLGSRPHLRPYARVAGMGIVGGMVAVTLAYQFIYFGSTRPAAVVFGLESRRAFLSHAVYDFDAARYVVEQAPLRHARVDVVGWAGILLRRALSAGYGAVPGAVPDAASGSLARRLARGDPLHTRPGRSGRSRSFMVQHDPTGDTDRPTRLPPTCDPSTDVARSSSPMRRPRSMPGDGTNANGPIRETSPSRTSALRSLFGDLTVGQASEW